MSAAKEPDLPDAGVEIEHVEIPLRDGTVLAARVWLPKDALETPVPAILEYLPYRKRDGTLARDELTYPYFAAHGYAGVRVDLRGNGESTGLMADEYLPQEQADALEVIDWIAAQPWCDGSLGMMGISWGGFNSLQVAGLRPAPLKAIITLCSTDDRYADDVHYKGGVLMNENLGWAATMLSFSAAVPDPALVPEWKDRWLERLDQMPLLAKNWMQHQLRDDYWRHGSVCEDYGAITIPVFAVGGWGDAYKNTVPRLLEHLSSPCQVMIGPWIHKYPHFAVPQPTVGFLQEALRWWDRWLHDRSPTADPAQNLPDAVPSGRFYVQDSVPPAPMHAFRPGRWVRTAGWPDPCVTSRVLSLTDGGSLSADLEDLSTEVAVRTPLTAGTGQGEYCAIWTGPDLPTDQRADDAYAATWDSDPLTQPMDLLGRPQVSLRLASSTDAGQVTVRLNDVRPDGGVALITYGVLNLRLRETPDLVTPVRAGEAMEVTVALDMVGYRIPAGHQLRVSVSSANFPLLMPPPVRSDLTVLPGRSLLTLPIFSGDDLEVLPPPAVSAPGARLRIHRAAKPRRTVSTDVASGETTVVVEDDLGDITYVDHGLRVDQRCREEYVAHPELADRYRAAISWEYEASREGHFRVRVVSTYVLTCDESTIYLQAQQVAHCDGQQVHQRSWREEIARVAS
ncbi:MAG: CocE/NonD family hydrolase [Ornithinimicrobium sp.]|uniref:CocE/NonD family hydrolase n=1 Tax=Ornithinimicrobium sp. TaxID=1977084 RepID=UPI0026DFF5D2|nr:CocE/NonD family hydrolase [Ornithinimicrobium sp.]MDO5739771.1 CocE/NonD family hydrolase [Ornithinimicrobium sp.]